ncbi:nitrilase-related carbon-nitrogen hydrolase [Apirhabdus apintestini]|nr:nitrilase-related carbon-nitrogen hydrolase [Enterobacteriaceae bacterium CA-0114]
MEYCCCTIRHSFWGIGANIVPHLDFIERAASESVDLLIFPEASLHGDDMRECCENVLHSPLLAPLQQAAVKHAMTIVVGLVHKDACGQLSTTGKK